MDPGSLWRVDDDRKEIDEIGRMGQSKKQKEDGIKSRKVEDGIGNVGTIRGTFCRNREMSKWTGKA
jgi:hypothetical protein